MIFDTAKYYEKQITAFMDRLDEGDMQVIEFGGKPFGDYHASRVLPGYDPDIKARILQDLHRTLGNVSMTLVLNARDVISPPDGRRIAQRIRGDSGLRYDNELIRLVDQARDDFDLPIESVTLTSVPIGMSESNQEYIDNYRERLDTYGLSVRAVDYIPGYPLLDAKTIESTLTQFEPNSEQDQSLIILSPGGGSGKFCVAVTEIAHKLKRGGNPNFIKFETFPVFHLEPDHPLNIAFLAATADLPNVLLSTPGGKTNYDKDLQNLAILQTLMTHYAQLDSPLHRFNEPTDMGVNVIEAGIIDEAGVNKACLLEILRRIERYAREAEAGDEDPDTAGRARLYLGSLGANLANIDQATSQRDVE